jgi:hypothetical protein
MPDTQNYSYKSPSTYYAQTAWIADAAGKLAADNVTDRNVKFVVHLGDITNNNTTSQWNVAHLAHYYYFDSYSIPYSVAYGNHDIYSDGSMAYRETDNFNYYFGPDRFSGESWYGGSYPSGTNNNSYCYFDAGDDLEFLVLSLEFAPQKDTLKWASNILNANQDKRVIVVTHGYCKTEKVGSVYTPIHLDVTTGYDLVGSDGETLWNEFISRFSNIFMVIAGHSGGDSVRALTGLNGNTVYEVLIDYQFENDVLDADSDGNTTEDNGNGWLKTIDFSPDQDAITMDTITVISGITTFSDYWYYPTTASLHTTDTLSYDMSGSIGFAYDDDLVGFNDRYINSVATNQQYQPEVSAAGNGDFVAVWKSNDRTSSYYDIKIRGFSVDGFQKFSERRVDSSSSYYTCNNPDVAVNESGDVVVVWEELYSSSSYNGYIIRTKGYDTDGNVNFGPTTVAYSYDGRIGDPSVDIDSSGNFVVVWEDDSDNNGYYQIKMKGLDADGDTRFGPSTVNSVADGQQLNPDVAVATWGSFVVVFQDDQDGNGYYEILMRGFYSSGSQRFAQATVNATSTGQQYYPEVAMADSGRFAVTWQDGRSYDGYDIYTRGFYYGGSQLFSERMVNTSTDGTHVVPKIAMSGDGDFGITWRDDTDGNGYYQIYARVYSISGSTILGQTTVNKDGSGIQRYPAISIDDDNGSIVVVWSDDIDGNGYYQILGRGSSEHNYIFWEYDE